MDVVVDYYGGLQEAEREREREGKGDCMFSDLRE